MCGIVGYYGPENPKDVIIAGLKALEYRGYDSAGVAILHDGHFKRVRAEGKLANLENKLNGEKFDGHLGIGHTRWATHGKPSERNAHPHTVGGVSIVHNGIIENYAELRESLAAQGSVFESETDSELVAHLLYQQVSAGKKILEAVFEILPMLRGAFSILAVYEGQKDEMVAFKNGPPLVFGVGSQEVLVASDIQAIMPHTRNIVFLEDNEIVHAKGLQWSVYNGQGVPLTKTLVEMKWSPELVEKKGFKHFMLKEIFEQPRAVAAALFPHIDLTESSVRLSRVGFSVESVQELDKLNEASDHVWTQQVLQGIERIFIVACGTSYYAGLAGEYMIERLSGTPTEVDIASEFRYRHPVIPPQSLVVLISQSGETADTLAALRLAKDHNAKILSICNVKNSSIDRESHGHLYMNAGVEIGVASTKAFTATLGLLNVFAMAMAKAKGRLSRTQEREMVQQLIAAPSQMEKVLNYQTFFANAAHSLRLFKGFLYMGRGVNYAVALEGALKLKELAYLHAEGYAAGEMKHGPLALIDDSMAVIMLCPKDETYEKTVSNLEEAKARGGRIISIGSGEDSKLKKLSLHYLALPEAHWMINPLLEVIPLQLLAYHLASSLGHDVDQPRNLAKSVTVE